MTRERALDRAFLLGTGACAALAVAVLVGLVAVLFARAAPVLELGLLWRESAEAGAAGGLRWQITGTLILVTSALAVAAPMAVALGLAMTVYLRPAAARRLRTLMLVAHGVPSIVFGLFGFAVFVRWLAWGKSWLAGGIVLALMILPTLAVAFADRLDAVPRATLEAAAGLGLSRERIVRAVLVPEAFGGLVSGALLGLARAAGETAPILFTAAVFSGATLPRGIAESPVLALPYHIFNLAQDAFHPGVEGRLWGAACVLLLLVFTASLTALPARLRLAARRHHG